MAVQPGAPATTGFPEGEQAVRQVKRRRQRGTFWRTLFRASTLIGIIALAALLYNIIDSSFGYVAIQNAQDPGTLVMALEKERVLAAPNVTSSEDDNALAAGVAANPFAAGFFGYAYYQEHADTLRLAPVEGVLPTAETVESGDYPLARPLYLYSSERILEEKPQVAAFIHFYLERVNELIDEVGYFPASAPAIARGLAAWTEATGLETPPAEVSGDIHMAGSSTVYPLSQRLADAFQAAGYEGEITIENIGTSAGFTKFCTGEGVDIVNASREALRGESEACRRNQSAPLGFRVGADALAIVVSQENDFVDSLTLEQLETLFTTAETWADVNPDWPAQPVARFVPGPQSGTLDYFVEAVIGLDLASQPKEQLVRILEQNVSAGLMRRLEHDRPFAERSRQNVYELVMERVVEPEIVRSWSLTESLLKRSEIEAEVASIPSARLNFRSWVTPDFIASPQSSKPEFAGIRTAILGSLWVIAITILFALPVGIGAAIYLEEFASDNWFNRLVETNINNLAGVPSIIYGMLGLAIFVRALEPLTSGAFLGIGDPATANGRTILSAGLTLGLLILPLIIINAREAIRAVPASLRQASYGLGATRWQTIWSHVLPGAMPGIMTGAILSISRAIGETAPLVVIGASTFILVDPSGPFSKFTTLPIQIYQWTARPQAEFRNLAAAAIVVLLILLLSLNATAVLLRNRFSR
ncbi:MAG TPA: phosphate ABC transporter permease PstA [Caldilineaceae bacterium]|nr:phosphate ABC transporter permease PstA [Caldilineaceae bacterium]